MHQASDCKYPFHHCFVYKNLVRRESTATKRMELLEDLLESNRSHLEGYVTFDDISPELISKGLITLSQKSDIEESYIGNYNKIDALISVFLKSDLCVTLPKFIQILRNCGSSHVADTLMKEYYSRLAVE